jgi:hypothetical protein
MKNYETYQQGNRTYILTDDNDRTGTVHAQPNWMGTGKALAGILAPGDTMEKWLKRKAKKK